MKVFMVRTSSSCILFLVVDTASAGLMVMAYVIGLVEHFLSLISWHLIRVAEPVWDTSLVLMTSSSLCDISGMRVNSGFLDIATN